MVFNIAVPDRYPYVLLVAVSTSYLTAWQTYLVGRARKAAKVDYPQVYAEKAEALANKDAQKFNCAQRAHQNTLEFMPATVISLLVAGLRHPEISAGLGAAWLFGRVLYTQGYITGDPKKRRRGGWSMVVTLGLLLTATWTAGEFVAATL